jgi:hypothetical protein
MQATMMSDVSPSFSSQCHSHISLFADDMILYHKDPKHSTQKLPDTINRYSKVAGYKINLEKSLAFLYTNNEQIEKEYMKTIPFTIALKKSNT